MQDVQAISNRQLPPSILGISCLCSCFVFIGKLEKYFLRCESFARDQLSARNRSPSSSRRRRKALHRIKHVQNKTERRGTRRWIFFSVQCISFENERRKEKASVVHSFIDSNIGQPFSYPLLLARCYPYFSL